MATESTFGKFNPYSDGYVAPDGDSAHINVSDTERSLSIVAGGTAAFFGLRSGKPVGFAIAAAGVFLMYRGLSGNCPVNTAIGRDTADKVQPALEIMETITIKKSPHEVYDFWRRLENLPLFMKHLEKVKEIDHLKSEWTAKIPGHLGTVTWQAEIVEEYPGSKLSWRSLPGATIHNAGEVVFSAAPASQGTEIRAIISYRPPVGALGKALAKALSPAFQQMVKEDIRKVKMILETGEIATIQGQPTGKKKRSDDLRNINKTKV